MWDSIIHLLTELKTINMKYYVQRMNNRLQEIVMNWNPPGSERTRGGLCWSQNGDVNNEARVVELEQVQKQR